MLLYERENSGEQIGVFHSLKSAHKCHYLAVRGHAELLPQCTALLLGQTVKLC